MDDVIREQGHNVPELMRIEILVKGGEVINKGKTSNIVLFYAAKINKTRLSCFNVKTKLL